MRSGPCGKTRGSPLDRERHPRRQVGDRDPVEGTGEPDAAERSLRGRADPFCELRGVAERRVRVESEVVGDERHVRAEERLQSPALPPVDHERLVAPEEPVVDEHHVGSLGGGLLEERARARDATGEQRHLVAADHLKPGRRELRPAFDLEQRVRVGDDLVPPGHGHSLGAAAEPRRVDRRARPPSRYPVGARGVAQPGSALRSGRRGPQFESGHPDMLADAGSASADPASRGSLKPGTRPCVHSPCAALALPSARARILGRCCGLCSSTWTSRSRGPGPSSGRRRTGGSAPPTASTSIPGATRQLGSPRSRIYGRTPSSSTTRRSGSPSPRTSSVGWAGTPAGARACAADMVRRWEVHANFDLYDDALPVLASLRERGLRDRPDLERPARPRGVRAPPRPRRRCRRRLEEPRPDQAARLDLRDAPSRLSVSRPARP